MMRILGADISHWESLVDWHKAVQYLPFVYYKCTDGLHYIDVMFGHNQDGCNEVGVPHAPYHWWQETLDPIGQAEFFIETAGMNYKRYIIDVEPQAAVPNMVNKLKQLLDRCEQLTSIKPAIYTSAYYWNTFIRPIPAWTNQYDLLVAHYAYRLNPTLPLGWAAWKIWQNTDYFWFYGCNEIADGNWFNGTLQECRDWFGNYHPYNLIPPEPTLDFMMECIVDSLNVRSGPGTNYSIVGHLHKGDEVALLNIGGSAAWMQIKSGEYAGKWCAVQTSMRYMEPV